MPKVTKEAAPSPAGMTVETVPLDSLHLDPANARMHGEKNLDAIKASLKEFGQVEALVCARDGKIIGGNGRYEAMRSLGWTHASVNYVDASDIKQTSLGIALNRTAELAEWDHGVLGSLLDTLKDSDVDVASLGYDDADLTALARQLEAEQVDGQTASDVDELPDDVKSVCRLGDLWQVGRHRLLCGDSSKIDDVQAICGNDKMHAVVTDPPYGVNYVGKTKDSLTIQNDGKLDLKQLLQDCLSNAMTVCLPGSVWYVWSPPGPLLFDFATVLGALGVWRQTIIWVKDVFVLGHSDYHYRHEVCFYGWTEGKHMATPDRTQDSVWEVSRPKRSAEHPTMKPVELMERCIKNSTIKGQFVFEPFCGSGTTLLACEQTGRDCRAIELDPFYCDVILRRWSKLTGQDPVLISGPDEDTGDATAAACER